MRPIPYGTQAAADYVLNDFYRQLTAAERRHAAAEALLASLDENDPDIWDLVDEAAAAVDAASDQVAEIERDIERLERELQHCLGREFA